MYTIIITVRNKGNMGRLESIWNSMYYLFSYSINLKVYQIITTTTTIMSVNYHEVQMSRELLRPAQIVCPELYSLLE